MNERLVRLHRLRDLIEEMETTTVAVTNVQHVVVEVETKIDADHDRSNSDSADQYETSFAFLDPTIDHRSTHETIVHPDRVREIDDVTNALDPGELSEDFLNSEGIEWSSFSSSSRHHRSRSPTSSSSSRRHHRHRHDSRSPGPSSSKPKPNGTDDPKAHRSSGVTATAVPPSREQDGDEDEETTRILESIQRDMRKEPAHVPMEWRIPVPRNEIHLNICVHVCASNSSFFLCSMSCFLSLAVVFPHLVP